ncbi:serine/threonine-protein kinase [Virgibacillus sp. 179-BFC.A HS]|uniref:Serine/threonine-protein kinase n=1 Tax=Tigheibacillus jepli TaxID=3035914 RepID=A0ABU5CCG2_9BACI|nr:serine/threonine-protein kinase [Virgibacillus sp. 179-BFC.A HS]MDY0404027.1 serine/threonine-protein kinase [Virgibacillus sp. 179-BFC.A HS]
MMHQTSKKLNLVPNTIIRGKWHNHVYTIRRKLGSGAIGSVYLCTINQKYAALKISDKSTSMMMEVNVLKSLNKVQGVCLGPSLMDVDDWIAPDGQAYTFYVMEYVRGYSLQQFLSRNGREWVGVLMLQLLHDLKKLHEAGWIFGDLKEENLLVTIDTPSRVRWIDVGGTTQMGRAIKEYSEFYDRGYWEMGSRKAEPSYDLFALAMVFISLYYPKQFAKDKHPQRLLVKKLQDITTLRPYRPALQKALLGEYQTAGEMEQEISSIISRMRPRHTSRQKTSGPAAAAFVPEVAGLAVVSAMYYLFSLLLP